MKISGLERANSSPVRGHIERVCRRLLSSKNGNVQATGFFRDLGIRKVARVDLRVWRFLKAIGFSCVTGSERIGKSEPETLMRKKKKEMLKRSFRCS